MLDCSVVGEAFSKAKDLLKDVKEDPTYLRDTKLAFMEFYLELTNQEDNADPSLLDELSNLFDIWYNGNDSIETVCQRLNGELAGTASTKGVLH